MDRIGGPDSFSGASTPQADTGRPPGNGRKEWSDTAMVSDEPVTSTITVFLADDSLIVREGVRGPARGRSPISRSSAWPRTSTGWSPAPTELAPQVVVTDIRMPPNFQNEGIEARQARAEAQPRHRCRRALAVRRARVRDLAALSEGAAGYAYLLKDRVGDGDQLVRAVRDGRDRRQRCSTRRSSTRSCSRCGHRRARRARRRAPPVDRRGPAGEGDRGRAEHHARGRERRVSRTCS